MTVTDGVPHPATVDGETVVSARWPEIPEGRENDPTIAGRTLLVLEDGTKRNGCAECEFTHPHWSAVVKHRTDVHGAPPAKRARYRRPREDQPDGDGQLALDAELQGTHTDTEAEPPFEGEVFMPTLATPDTSTPAFGSQAQAIKLGPLIIPAAVAAMSVTELMEAAAGAYNAGELIERQRGRIDELTAELKKARKALNQVNRLMGRAQELMSRED